MELMPVESLFSIQSIFARKFFSLKSIGYLTSLEQINMGCSIRPCQNAYSCSDSRSVWSQGLSRFSRI